MMVVTKGMMMVVWMVLEKVGLMDATSVALKELKMVEK
jgi:hypothetical protein